nr:MAG TPA: hypothetical protein [Caudoviricetes sp.]
MLRLYLRNNIFGPSFTLPFLSYNGQNDIEICRCEVEMVYLNYITTFLT